MDGLGAPCVLANLFGGYHWRLINSGSRLYQLSTVNTDTRFHNIQNKYPAADEGLTLLSFFPDLQLGDNLILLPVVVIFNITLLSGGVLHYILYTPI